MESRTQGWSEGANPVIPAVKPQSGPGNTEAQATNDGPERTMGNGVTGNPVIGSISVKDVSGTTASINGGAGREFATPVKGNPTGFKAGSKGSGGI